MKGILVLAHGSRKSATEHTLEMIMEMLKELLSDMVCEVEYCFIEFSDRTIEVGLDTFVNRGIKDIIVIPYFLFDGVHIRECIPRGIENYLQKHQNEEICIKLGKTLGADSRLAGILADRIREEI